MIGLDTNILVRYILQDDPLQSPKSDAMIASLSGEAEGWIAQATILELVWVLRSKKKLDRPGIATILDRLLQQNVIAIERGDVLRQALLLFRNGKADFADCLIAASARAAGCEVVLTFDRTAARDAGMQWAG
jgi:predicted nucleic-acid-binding protein